MHDLIHTYIRGRDALPSLAVLGNKVVLHCIQGSLQKTSFYIKQCIIRGYEKIVSSISIEISKIDSNGVVCNSTGHLHTV